jgi:nitrogen regulatory protein PII
MEFLDAVIDAIIGAATGPEGGPMGDGKIFVSQISDAISVS